MMSWTRHESRPKRNKTRRPSKCGPLRVSHKCHRPPPRINPFAPPTSPAHHLLHGRRFANNPRHPPPHHHPAWPCLAPSPLANCPNQAAVIRARVACAAPSSPPFSSACLASSAPSSAPVWATSTSPAICPRWAIYAPKPAPSRPRAFTTAMATNSTLWPTKTQATAPPSPSPKSPPT